MRIQLSKRKRNTFLLAYLIRLYYLIIINVVWRILKSNLKSNIKILLIGIILIMFQPLQTSGRFFSSNVALFNFYIISLYYFFLINLKKNNNS
jgi:hypothetical protein